MASVPDVSNCTEKPEPTSSVVNGRRSYSAGSPPVITTCRALNACTASRTCSGDIMAQVLVSSVLIIMSAIDTRRSGSANHVCFVSHHEHLTGHAWNRTNTDGVPPCRLPLGWSQKFR